MKIEFGEKSIVEIVYVRLDTENTLLLSEKVCSELGIVSYHPDVQTTPEPAIAKKNKKGKITLVQTVRLPADSCAIVQVKVAGLTDNHLLLEPDESWRNTVIVADCLLKNDGSGTAPIILSNASLSTQILKKGTYLGKAATVNLINSEDDNDSQEAENDLPLIEAQTYSNERVCWQKQKLGRQIQIQCPSSQSLSAEEMNKLLTTLEQYHDVFSLEDEDRGETNHVEFTIDTGDSAPIKQAARRVPYSARQEIATQLN